MNSSDEVLTWADLAVIEKLAGAVLADSLKEWLYAFYGPEGKRIRYWREQERYRESCDNHCDDCGVCIAYCEDPLLDQLFAIILCWRKGAFDIEKDNYETVCCKVRYRFSESRFKPSPF